MNFRHLLLSLALLAGVFVLPGCKKAVEYKDFFVSLDATDNSCTMWEDGRAFPVFWTKILLDGRDETRNYTVEFELTAQGGRVSNSPVYSRKTGVVHINFVSDDPENFQGGTVVAKPVCIYGESGLPHPYINGDQSITLVINPAQ